MSIATIIAVTCSQCSCMLLNNRQGYGYHGHACKHYLVPISQFSGSAPLLNSTLFINERHLISSGVWGIPIIMPPRHRPISSVQARSTSISHVHDGAAVSVSGDSIAATEQTSREFTYHLQTTTSKLSSIEDRGPTNRISNRDTNPNLDL